MVFSMATNVLEKHIASIFRVDFYCYLYEDGCIVTMFLVIFMVRNKKIQWWNGL
jgi:hypothetical protein